MHDIIYSDIKIIELKLKRIALTKERLLDDKPSKFNKNKYEKWYFKFKNLERQESDILKELHDAYIELEKYLK